MIAITGATGLLGQHVIENLLQTVWGYDYFGDVRTVDVTVIRQKGHP